MRWASVNEEQVYKGENGVLGEYKGEKESEYEWKDRWIDKMSLG